MPTLDTAWPYGLGGTALGSDALRGYVSRPSFVILLGTEDIDTEQESLRKTEEAMRQGPHRFARGKQFAATASETVRLSVQLPIAVFLA